MPKSMDIDEDSLAAAAISRPKAQVNNISGNKYKVAELQLTEHQYFKLYMRRLNLMRPVIENHAKKVYPSLSYPASIVDFMQCSGDCVIIGTVFNKMAKKPAALHQFIEDHPKVEIEDGCYISEDDIVILEDGTSRLILVGEPIRERKALATGTIIGVKGKLLSGDTFNVEQVFLPGFAPQKPLPIAEEEKWVAFISGMEFGRSTIRLPLQLAQDYLTGYLGDAEQNKSAKIVRLVIAGNIVKANKALDEVELVGFSTSTKLEDKAQLRVLGDVDTWLSSLCGSMEVDIMPGSSDPSNYFLPQQPFHRCLFPLSSSLSSYNAVTNPFSLDVDGVHIQGSSGQNVNDQKLYVSSINALDIMEGQLRIRNMCPTAPDTVGCFPYLEEDPFIMSETPHVYFAGNQREFATRLCEDHGVPVRLISIPSFWQTHQIVLLNLKNLDCNCIGFGIN